MATSQRRCVFVGNISYDATEEQLIHICEEVGPVVLFRLVTDRETGKPKGYGFCEYKDEETALSARRNLQGCEINGRQLRVDFAENDKNAEKSREQATSKLLHSTMKNTSMTISNMIGPVEHMALANHPIKGLFFTASGLPQSLTVGLMSYVGTLRATIATEEVFIDPNTMKLFIHKAYEDRSSKSSNAASAPVRRSEIPAYAR